MRRSKSLRLALMLFLAPLAAANAITVDHECSGYYVPWAHLYDEDNGKFCSGGGSPSTGASTGSVTYHCSHEVSTNNAPLWEADVTCIQGAGGSDSCSGSATIKCQSPNGYINKTVAISNCPGGPNNYLIANSTGMYCFTDHDDVTGYRHGVDHLISSSTCYGINNG